MNVEVDDRVVAAEHDDYKGGKLKPNGRRYPATVVNVTEAYIIVQYDDRQVNLNRPDLYWRESGWRAWDGALSWKLQPYGEEVPRLKLEEPE